MNADRLTPTWIDFARDLAGVVVGVNGKLIVREIKSLRDTTEPRNPGTPEPGT